MKVELCVASAKAIDLAAKYRLDRVEVCQNLEVGGTTPSFGLVERALNKGLNTHVLIRPRMGGFVYSAEEREVIQEDIKRFIDLGVHGIVIGCVDDSGNLNIGKLGALREQAPKIELTFHRAFDDLVNWRDGIDQLIQSGFNRILTSGLASSVDVGISNLEHIKDLTRGRIDLMVGGGINPKNVKEVIQRIRPEAIHFSATTLASEESHSKFSAPRLEIDEVRLNEILALI